MKLLSSICALAVAFGQTTKGYERGKNKKNKATATAAADPTQPPTPAYAAGVINTVNFEELAFTVTQGDMFDVTVVAYDDQVPPQLVRAKKCAIYLVGGKGHII